jgi:PAS domain S-box-containing protein
MNILSSSVVAMAGISLYVGFYHLLIYVRRPQRRVDLTFALLCFSVVFYDAFCVGLYNAISVGDGVQWQRAQLIAIAVFVPALLWFVSDYTRQKPGIVVYASSIYYLLAILVQLVDRSSLTWLVDQPSIKHIMLPFSLSITYYEATFGPFTAVQSLLGMLVSIQPLIVSIRYYRSGHKKEALPLILAMGFMFVAAFHDTLVGNGLYHFIYLMEYAYLGIIVVMAYSISNTVMEVVTAKDALKKSEERFRSLIETTSDWVWEVNVNGAYTYASPKVRELLGYEPEEIVGRMPFDLMPAEEARRVSVLFQDSVHGQKPFQRIENICQGKDGRLMTLETSGVPYFDEHGRLSGYRGIDRDITERKQIETEREALIQELETRNAETETLRESMATIASKLEFSDVIQQILDQVRRVVPYDSASVWKVEDNHQIFIGGRNLPPEITSNISYLIDETNSAHPILLGDVAYILHNDVQAALPDFREPPNNYINSWLAVPLEVKGKIVGLLALDGIRKNQFTERHVELAVTYADQVAIALENSLLFTDLQEQLSLRKNLIAELESKNAELERFTYTVSHDLKSPLVTINGFLGYLEKDAGAGNMERLHGDIQRIQDAVNKMRRLLSDLLELSRIGRLVNTPQMILFADLAQDALDAVHGQLEERGITVIIQPNLPAVFGDRQRLTEVLQNLLDNAAKFMGDQKNPQIEIGQLGKEETHAIFFVKDNGMGIAPKYHEQVFGLFNKLNQDVEGTGIGLALVKRIVEVHGGRIWVESAGLGCGTTFLFTLACRKIGE